MCISGCSFNNYGRSSLCRFHLLTSVCNHVNFPIIKDSGKGCMDCKERNFLIKTKFPVLK